MPDSTAFRLPRDLARVLVRILNHYIVERKNVEDEEFAVHRARSRGEAAGRTDKGFAEKAATAARTGAQLRTDCAACFGTVGLAQ